MVAGVWVPRVADAANSPAFRMAPGPVEAEDPRAGLRVDTDALGEQGKTIAEKIRERAGAQFIEAGFLGVSAADDPVVVVVVERSTDPENPGYVVGFSIERGDEIVPDSARQSACALCTRTELIERVERELPPLLELCRANQSETASGGEGGEDGGEGGEDGGGDEGVSFDDRPIGSLGFAGIGAGVLGLVGIGLGAGLVATPPTVLEDRPFEQRSTATPGYISLVVGGVALIAGVVLIGIDVSKRKRHRSERNATLKPRWTGLGLQF